MTDFEKFYIDGQWVTPQSNQRLNVINPATTNPVATIALGNREDAELAIAAARRAFPGYSSLSREQRMELLQSVIAVYEKRLPEVADAITSEMGAPLKAIAQPMQAGAMLGHLHVAAAVLKDYDYCEDQGPTRIQRETDWCLRPDNAMELADPPDRLQGGTRASQQDAQ